MSLSLETMTTSTPEFSARARERADHVVGFETRVFKHRNAHGVERLANPGNLLQQIRRRLGAVGLVGLERLVAKGGPFALEDRGQVFRLVLRLQLAHHVVEDVDRLGGNPRRGAHRRRAGPRPGVISAEDEAERVDQEEPGHTETMVNEPRSRCTTIAA